ncbi:MAG: rhodanese-like domain-containing protein [Spiribacter sp.]|jgi:rhodanese-related sulfurtransferase|nr:rhodanese-like domain-containing protein [Spiribacter sp.]MDR9489360.1 rhodanese-like domain-containing protein [Spiribacter sp.]
MDRVIEFSFNNPLLIAALAVVLAAIIANEYMNFRRSRNAIDTTEATLLYNRDAAVFVDIRNENAYQSSHLPGAINIPMEHLDKQQDRLKRFKDRAIVVYCDRGQRTLKAVQALQAQGWSPVHQLRGGLDAWREASMPTEGRG